MHTNGLQFNEGGQAPLLDQPVREITAQKTIDGAAELVSRPTLHELAPLIRDALSSAWESLLPAGGWLKEIRDLKLWFPKYENFAACCREEFGISTTRGYQLVEAQEVVVSLSNFSTTGGMNERQLRELAKVPEEKRVEVLEKAMAAAASAHGKLTAKIIRKMAREVCPELHVRAVKKVQSAVKIGAAPVRMEDILEVFKSAQFEERAKFLYHLKDRWLWGRIFKGQTRKLALVEATKAGKPSIKKFRR